MSYLGLIKQINKLKVNKYTLQFKNSIFNLNQKLSIFNVPSQKLEIPSNAIKT